MVAYSNTYGNVVVTKDQATAGNVTYFDALTGNSANTTVDLLAIILIELRAIHQTLQSGLNVADEANLFRSDITADLTVIQTPPAYS